ncbi:2Fe-2S iron-sulfur cluster-binding protein [Arthrobacter halodurans]|uniref:2Fe-2S iron-sulfur cluster-binding protein n=1 Tax=Arthrobacter halodurans TaxID=516699 RepID=A0ABV4UR00_9MICC
MSPLTTTPQSATTRQSATTPQCTTPEPGIQRRLTYLQPDGTSATVEADPGHTVMRAALANNVEGIVAECGGNAMCATCHVYVDPKSDALLPPVGANEDELLDCTAAERRSGSRLSCQLPAVDGLTVRVPECQQ